MYLPRFVFCGGMFRSGSTLQFNIAAELIERTCVGRREKWITDHSEYFYKCTPSVAGCFIAFKSHILSPEIKRVIAESNHIVLSCYRDVRDSVASFQAKTGSVLSMNDALGFAVGAILRFSEWEELMSADKLISRYEDIIRDIRSEVLRVADFIGIDSSPHLLSEISSELSMQKRISVFGEENLISCGSNVFDSKTLVHCNHLNGGTIGRSKNELSHDIYNALTDTHADWLLAHGYQL